MITDRKKIAIVVQRAGEDIVGGSEGYALSMARILSCSFDVDIITTRAKDHVSWKNEYSGGISSLSESLRIIRFKVAFERETYWFELDRIAAKKIAHEAFQSMSVQERFEIVHYKRSLPLGFGEEWLKYEGPYSPELMDYIEKQSDNYDYFIFMTYLYPTTYFGIDRVKDPQKVFIVPTFHDEPPAYLANFGKYRKYKHLFLTNAEKNIAERSLYRSKVHSSIIGFGIQDRFEELGSLMKKTEEKYVLYAGRLEIAKGVNQMFELFERYSKENGKVKLYLIGDGHLKDHRHGKITYKGFVNETEKLQIMNNAIAFIHPSAFESLGIVLLESFMMGTPALVNKRSDVLNEHIINSEAGYSYDSYEEFRDALTAMMTAKETYNTLCENARNYYLKNYSLTAYEQKLIEVLNQQSAI